jgi:hypothetical protein
MPEQAEGPGQQTAVVLAVPWKPTSMAAVKGLLHTPASKTKMTATERDVLLTAIAKARAWIEDLTEGRVTSFADIAKREGKVERHIRLLAPLAFVSPSIVANMADGDDAETVRLIFRRYLEVGSRLEDNRSHQLIYWHGLYC